jgi:hypothetical protein
MPENAPIVASLLTRSRDPSPLLLHPSVYSCCLATNEARRCATRRGLVRLGLARRKHRFIYCCVIAGMCFDVTVLAWRKYATIFLHGIFYFRIFPYEKSCVHFSINTSKKLGIYSEISNIRNCTFPKYFTLALRKLIIT